MSEQVKRFIVDMKGTGVECVFASDYDALQAEYEEELFCVRQTRDSHFGGMMRAIEQVDALQAEYERLRVKLMVIASAEPARHGIEWAKALAAEGNSEPYEKWREAIDERDALRAEIAAIKAREPLGWITDDYQTDKSATTYDSEVAGRWRQKGWPVVPIYL